MSVVRWFSRKETAPDGAEISSGVLTVTPEVADTAAVGTSSPIAILTSVVKPTPWQKLIRQLTAAFQAVDNAFSALAIPFGVTIRNPRRRYLTLLSVFAGLFIIGALPVPYLPLVALGVGYVGVLAISRAWVVNERLRTDIVKKLRHDNPDSLPDLRWTALEAALQLLILFPLVYMQVHRQFGLYRVETSANFFDWFWFALDKTYLKALPDWSILYGVHISSIDFKGNWDRHLVLLSRLTFDYILIQGAVRLMAIRGTIREAVAVIKTDPDVAVRVGTRAIPALIDKLSDPDRAVRGAAANVITQLGDPEGMKQMSEAFAESAARAE